MAALQTSLLLLHRPIPLFFPPKPSPSLRLRLCLLHHHRPLLRLRSSLNPDPVFGNQETEVSFAKGGGGGDDVAEAVRIDAGGEKEKGLEEVEGSRRLGVVAFLIGVWERARRGFLDRVAMAEWLSWWPFWRKAKRLEMLMAEADANPKDAAKQSALLAELNKHSPESVIRRFEERTHAVDSKGVAEYLRALVVTNALAEYLPDEHLGKPSSLPTLLQELKQRASGNEDEAFLNPGISEKQPLHVVMVNPKAANRSTRFAQELFSTILFTVIVGLM